MLVAIGAGPNPTLFDGCEGLERSERGYIRTFNDAGRTSVPSVWAGGDIVTGSATVILAMGAARLAAADMHAHLSNGQSAWPGTGAATAPRLTVPQLRSPRTRRPSSTPSRGRRPPVGLAWGRV